MKKPKKPLFAELDADDEEELIEEVAAPPEPKLRPKKAPKKTKPRPDDARPRYISSAFPERVKRQFDTLAAQLGRSKQDLHAEALNLLFERYSLEPIAAPFESE